MKNIFVLITLLVIDISHAAAGPVKVFPDSAYDRSTIYLNLAVFWGAVAGLIVILKMKLRESERVQRMDVEEDTEKTPLLE